jgi:hypothetical protein
MFYLYPARKKEAGVNVINRKHVRIGKCETTTFVGYSFLTAFLPLPFFALLPPANSSCFSSFSFSLF